MSTATLQEWFLRLTFVVVGLIHLLPLSGVLGRSVLEKVYGVELPSPNLQILLQHRAVLFGLLGVACFVAVLDTRWRLVVGLAALVSTASFITIAWLTPGYSTPIARVVLFDAIALVLLLLAAAVQYFRQT
jgi:hypothetical protein